MPPSHLPPTYEIISLAWKDGAMTAVSFGEVTRIKSGFNYPALGVVPKPPSACR